jgi:DNA-binding transcriptional ArsR family regulator
MQLFEARLNLKLAALADPTRRALIERLQKGEASVSELARPFAMSQPAISKHLKVLEEAGLVLRSVDAQKRPCRLALNGLADVAQWMHEHRALWDQRLDRLETYIKTLKES